jgi:cytosine/adenosine deaminase-related metal-dependent hydrolase
MPRTLIEAHTLLTQSALHGDISNGGLIVEDGRISNVGPLEALRQQGPFDVVVGDANRHIALPGMVNGHHHSLRPPRVGHRPSFFESWLVRGRLRRVPALSEEEAYDHTLWGTLQFLKSGATAVVDHYALDFSREDYAVPAAVRAYLDAGVRAAVCLANSDQQRVVYQDEQTFVASLPPDLRETISPMLRPFDQETFFTRWERLAAEWDGKDGRIRLGFGPGGPQWCSDDLLRRLRRVADEHDNAPIQIHLLESKYQALYGYRRYDRSIVRHLDDIGFFGKGTSCAHCVWVSREDIALLAEVGAVAVHNPSSNLALMNGIAPVADMLDGGMKVGFGLDAAGLNDDLDMLTDLRLAHFLQRRPGVEVREVTPADTLGMATHAGADALGLSVQLGRLEHGYAADVVLVDRTRLYGSPYVSPSAPAAEVLLRRAEAGDVEHVMVAGRMVIQDRRAVGIDEQALQRRIATSLERVYALQAGIDAGFEPLEPHITAFYRQWEAESAGLLPPNYQFNTR